MDDRIRTGDGAAAPIAPIAPGGGGTIAPVGVGGEVDAGGSAAGARHSPSGRSALGFGLTMITVVMWSVLPLGLKIALTGMDALTLTWYRFAAATVVLAAVLRLRGGLPDLAALGRGGWKLLAAATLGLSANYLLYVLGLERTNASTAQVVIQIAPMLLGLGSIWYFRERVGPVQWLGLVVLALGLVVFSREQIVALLDGLERYYTGLACMVAAAVSWAVYGMAQKQLLSSLTSPAVMLCIFVGATLLFTPMAAPGVITTIDATQLGALVFCIVNMLVAYGTFAEALAHWEASRISAVLALVPLATLAVVHVAADAVPTLVEREPISGAGVAGACMVVVGSLMMALAQGGRRG